MAHPDLQLFAKLYVRIGNQDVPAVASFVQYWFGSIVVVPRVDTPSSLDTECLDAAPGGPQTDTWLSHDLPAWTTSLETNAGATDAALPGNAFHVRNDVGSRAYVGAAPPPGDVASLGVDETSTPAITAFHIGAHTLARASITPTYQS